MVITFKGYKCQFPFLYNGLIYENQCVRHSSGGKWCAISTRPDKTVAKYDWCDDTNELGDFFIFFFSLLWILKCQKPQFLRYSYY